MNRDMDLAAARVCGSLSTAFGIVDEPEPMAAVPGNVSIGIEIEAPWSSYFPGLWAEFDMARRGFSGLTANEAREITQRCTDLERSLLPRLQKTIECGVPRGNDRYWEFSLDPVTDVSLLVRQVELLSRAGVLPRDRKHSLHVTVGNVRRTPDVYYLMMLLEVLYVDPERLRRGIEQTNRTIFTGWARKGLAGVFEKGSADLKFGSQVACEMRVLQLPVERAQLEEMMAMVSWAVNAIADIQGDRYTPQVRDWQQVVAHAKSCLERHGLPDRNWGAGGVNHEAWGKFLRLFQGIRNDLKSYGLQDMFPIPASENQRSRAIPLLIAGP